MRCQFCGWDNPQGRETCEKCNKPLASSIAEEAKPVNANQDNQSRPTDRYVEGAFNAKKTVREVSICGDNVNSEKTTECPECGYSMENGECSACGYKVGEKKNTPADTDDLRKTVRPIRKGEKEGEFRLIPISEETGMPEGEALSYEGNSVVLNRDNTDPKNSTITSQEQATITFENGKWSIKDNSKYRTTFVQAFRQIELQHGDMVLLGNQLYRFEL